MIKIPNECPDDTQLIAIAAAIKVMHGVDVFTIKMQHPHKRNNPWLNRRPIAWPTLDKLRKNYKHFKLWFAANYGELSMYGDADAHPGVEGQIEAGQGTESGQGAMVF